VFIHIGCMNTDLPRYAEKATGSHPVSELNGFKKGEKEEERKKSKQESGRIGFERFHKEHNLKDKKV
jgi:hypothetical protein